MVRYMSHSSFSVTGDIFEAKNKQCIKSSKCMLLVTVNHSARVNGLLNFTFQQHISAQIKTTTTTTTTTNTLNVVYGKHIQCYSVSEI